MNKEFRFEVKALGEGSFEGIASTYSNQPDLQGDIVSPGAFTRTLKAKGGQVPILWMHDEREPIGLGKLTDTPEGLLIHGELALKESPIAEKAYGLLKRGILKGLSIGFDTVKSVAEGSARRLTELKLFEVSLVTFPANEHAFVTAVKAQPDEIERAVKAIHKCTERFRKFQS